SVVDCRAGSVALEPSALTRDQQLVFRRGVRCEPAAPRSEFWTRSRRVSMETGRRGGWLSFLAKRRNCGLTAENNASILRANRAQDDRQGKDYVDQDTPHTLVMVQFERQRSPASSRKPALPPAGRGTSFKNPGLGLGGPSLHLKKRLRSG